VLSCSGTSKKHIIFNKVPIVGIYIKDCGRLDEIATCLKFKDRGK
jgi:hypothetical protein